MLLKADASAVLREQLIIGWCRYHWASVPRQNAVFGANRKWHDNVAHAQQGSTWAQPGLNAPKLDYIISSDGRKLASMDYGQKTVALMKPVRKRDKAHRDFVCSQPCVVCGRRPSDAHHVQFGQPRALGRKVSDEFTVPLCRVHHRDLHRGSDEKKWWEAAKIEPMEVARRLWRETRDKMGWHGFSLADAAIARTWPGNM
jgi:hypothetical protein